jgi:hypothetical protein
MMWMNDLFLMLKVFRYIESFLYLKKLYLPKHTNASQPLSVLNSTSEKSKPIYGYVTETTSEHWCMAWMPKMCRNWSENCDPYSSEMNAKKIERKKQ